MSTHPHVPGPRDLLGMASVCFPSLAFWIALVSIVVGGWGWMGSVAFAQDGRWVERKTPVPPSGIFTESACGDRVAVFTTTSTCDSVYFFDADGGSWHAWSFHDVMGYCNIVAVEAEGRTALVVTDSLAVAFTPGLLEPRVFVYSTPLLKGGSDGSYACGARCAMVVTEDEAAVFDATRGEWHIHPLPADSYSCPPAAVQCGDEYAAAALNRPYPQMPYDLFYSLVSGDFTSIEDGMRASYLLPHLNGGCAGLALSSETGAQWLVAWSARTGTAIRQVLDETAEIELTTCPSGPVGPRTVVLASMITRDDPDFPVVELWGWDAWSGVLSHFERTYSRVEERWTDGITAGGRIAAVAYRYDLSLDAKRAVVIFDGRSGSFHTLQSDLDWTASTVLGGDVGYLWDSDAVVGFTLDGGLAEASFAYSDPMVECLGAGPRWATFSHHDAGDPKMNVHVYRGDTNSWSSWSLQTVDEPYVLATEDVLVFSPSGGSPRQVGFYSPSIDLMDEVEIVGVAQGGRAAGPLGLAYTDKEIAVFDALRGALTVVEGEYCGSDRSSHVFAYVDGGGVTHGYSAVSGSWSGTDGLAEPFILPGEGLVALAAAGSSPLSDFAAFNGLADTWVPLAAEGEYTSCEVGRRTALVVCRGHLYGFTLQSETLEAVEDPDEPTTRERDGVGWTMEITGLAPNPTNPGATISFHLSRAGGTALEIYDLRGRLIRTVLEEDLGPGDHRAHWWGDDAQGKAVSAGIYLAVLRQGDRRVSRKLTIVR